MDRTLPTLPELKLVDRLSASFIALFAVFGLILFSSRYWIDLVPQSIGQFLIPAFMATWLLSVPIGVYITGKLTRDPRFSWRGFLLTHLITYAAVLGLDMVRWSMLLDGFAWYHFVGYFFLYSMSIGNGLTLLQMSFAKDDAS